MPYSSTHQRNIDSACDCCGPVASTSRHAKRLGLLPNVIAEVVFSDDDAAAIAKALEDGDLAEVGRLFSLARDRYVVELIERRKVMYRSGLNDEEAAERLCEVYS